jgi:glucuronate isomerase
VLHSFAAIIIECRGDRFHQNRKDRIARRLGNDSVKNHVVYQILHRILHRREHLGHFFGQRRMVFFPAAFGGQFRQVAFKNQARFKHLPGLKSVQYTHQTERRFAEFRWAISHKGSNAVSHLHHAHRCKVTDTCAQTGPADLEIARELALRRDFVSGLKSAILHQMADMVDHMHRSIGVRCFLLHPRHRSWPLLKFRVIRNNTRVTSEVRWNTKKNLLLNVRKRIDCVFLWSDLFEGRPHCLSRKGKTQVMLLDEDRLFPSEPGARKIARALYKQVRNLPLVSPHGHTQAAWFVRNEPFPDPAKLLVQSDHYIYRMLYSQGVSLEDLEIGQRELKNPRQVWRIFASHYYLFRGTPTRMWLDFAFQELFGLEQRLSEQNADHYFDTNSEKLERSEFLPRALFERFHLEVLATTDSPLDSLADHAAVRRSGWQARILPTFRPDLVVDPEFAGFAENITKLGDQNDEDTSTWTGYLTALRKTRHRFREAGSTATDDGHPAARTANITTTQAAELFIRVLAGNADAAQQELFRAQMLTEMARMSLEDGLVMQIHPGSVRNHNRKIFEDYGRDVGADIPGPTNYVSVLRPMLDLFGNERNLTIILFTLDESAYSRELAPLAGHYPCLRLGPPWWFHDSPEGMMRFRERVTETAGFYNTVGFNDDTRAFLSIPARHDVARRIDFAYLANLVSDHRLDEDEASELAGDLAYRLVKQAYRL